jgi:hypothetical protein
MRVAVSGTHGCGKSTLIDAFLLNHGDYLHEPEPYEQLHDLYGESFAAEPSADDYFRQLEYHLGRLDAYSETDRVIFERSAADFLAYLFALDDLGRMTADATLIEHALEMVKGGLGSLDLIVYTPAEDEGSIVAEAEDPVLRRAVDTRLTGILLDDDLGVFGGGRPSIVEAIGTTGQRLRMIESALR